MVSWNLFAFQDYRQETFPMVERHLRDQQDGRASSNNTIDASQLAESVLFQVLLGQSSLHQLDQWLRCDLADALFDRSNQTEFGSDTTLLEAADGWCIDDVRRCARALTDRLGQLGHLSLERPGDRTVQPATLDGSDFGGHFFSVLTCPGSSVQSLLDLQPYDSMGEERMASFRILRRLQSVYESVPFSHLLLDALYMDRNWLTYGYDLGFHPVIKTTDESLTCVQHLQSLWNSHQQNRSFPEDVSFIEGEDPCRGFDYNALQHPDLSWQGFDLNGLQLHITHTSGPYKGQSETYWVFTTDSTLSARGLRQLAHHRWSIENNQFKELNALVGSKSAYIQSQSTKHTVLVWQMIGWALFQSFRLHCEDHLASIAFGQTQTKSWLIERLKALSYQQMANAPPSAA
jgi:hypothetical protein